MKQYDVCRLRSGNDYAVVLQNDLIDELDTCVVAPLVQLDELPAVGRMRPIVRIDDTGYRVAMDRLAAIPRVSIGQVVRSLAVQQDEIKSAMDMLFFGF